MRQLGSAPRRGDTIRQTLDTDEYSVVRTSVCGFAFLFYAFAQLVFFSVPVRAQVLGEDVATPPIADGADAFQLSLGQMRRSSALKNFEIVGHSYFKIPQRTPWAKAEGRPKGETGAGFDSVRVHDGVAFLGGSNVVPSFFHVLIADVHDPQNMQPLTTLPCRPGTSCGLVRLDIARKILAVGNDSDPRNPNKAKAGSEPGWALFDVADPRAPKPLAFVPMAPGSEAHGMDLDESHLYACGSGGPDISGSALTIYDTADPAKPKPISEWHVPGQKKGEEFNPLNRNGPDGQKQKIGCQSVVYSHDRLYLSWGDAGVIVLDVTDRAAPKQLVTYDYVPPFHGGAIGAAHQAIPVVTPRGPHPDLIVQTDEIPDCPPGFGRIFDVSDLRNPEVTGGVRPANIQPISTFRLPVRGDRFEVLQQEFFCTGGGNTGGKFYTSAHVPLMDWRASSLLYVTWFDEGVRAIDISNPFAPRFVGYFLSPRFEAPGRSDRQPRDITQDGKTDLIYVTDGNGGGLFVLRYTGSIPEGPPIPAAR
jgi:hypothetical protein